jgi:hypothetical protein
VDRSDPGARGENVFSAGSAVIVLIAVAFLALHLPYFPTSLEDLDSINFALGVRQFDVAHHQPHPPGYPVYIALAKAVHAAVPDETRALALLSVVAGALGAVAMAALFGRLTSVGRSTWVPVALGLTSPLYWFTAARPLSDMPGLAAALAVQALTLGAITTRGLCVAAFSAGLATGIRSQVAWLTVPLLLARGLGTKGLGDWGTRSPHVPSPQSPAASPQPRAPTPVTAGPKPLAPTASFLAGVLVWAFPLVMLTGGPGGYWHALFDQGAEDLGNIQMLWTRHGVRDIADALYYAFVAPWAAWPFAAVVLVCAGLGIMWLWRHERRALAVLAVAFGPYLVLDVLFQETFTSRYALPLVVPLAYFAACGLRWAPAEAVWLLALPIAMYGAHIGGRSIAAYAQQKAPAFRLLDDMKRAAEATGVRPVLAPDRRESFDMRRPMLWMGGAMPPIARQLPAPPQHEWLEAVRYWNTGGREPVWFLVDPRRTAIDLVQHASPFEYQWPLPYPVLISGVRPNDVNWYAVDRPEWYVGEGWALTPEVAGVAAADHRGLGSAPIEGWVRRSTPGGMLMIGGRVLDPSRRPKLAVTFDDGSPDQRSLVSEILQPGAFLRFAPIPAATAVADAREYAKVSVSATEGNAVAIEQFDASPARILFGFGDGWHEQELNPRTGARWRWLSERGEIRLGSRPADPLRLHIEGESPLTYFSRGSRLKIRSGAQVYFDTVLSSDFSVTVQLPSGVGPIVLETDQVYVPADHRSLWRRLADQRHLGLRIFKVDLRTR